MFVSAERLQYVQVLSKGTWKVRVGKIYNYLTE